MKKTSIKNDIFSDLYQLVQERKLNPSGNSYMSLLLTKGLDKIHAKISEETAELIDASHNKTRDDIIHEAADLWFHTLMLLGYWDIPPEAVYDELIRRQGVSGLEEKAGRLKNEKSI